ncbi:MAG: ATP-binding cassette domain-containing protein [Acidimicrobiales bacterium]
MVSARSRWGISYFSVREIDAFAPVIERLRAIDAAAPVWSSPGAGMISAACPMPAQSIARLENITVSYNAKHALDNVSIVVGAGRSIALVGANGSGKTTLLNVLAGLAKPSAAPVTPSPAPSCCLCTQSSRSGRWMPDHGGRSALDGPIPTPPTRRPNNRI